MLFLVWALGNKKIFRSICGFAIWKLLLPTPIATVKFFSIVEESVTNTSWVKYRDVIYDPEYALMWLDCFILFLIRNVCLCVSMCTEVLVPAETREGVSFPGVRVTDSSELSVLGAGNHLWTLLKGVWAFGHWTISPAQGWSLKFSVSVELRESWKLWN